MNIETYVQLRNNGKQMEEIMTGNFLSEASAYLFELGYQCYLKKISLDRVIEIVKSLP